MDKQFKWLTLFLVFSTIGNAQEFDLYSKIKSLRPTMPANAAYSLSKLIHKYAKKHNGNAKLAIAIAMQETSLRQKNRTQNVIEFKKTCNGDSCVESWQVIKGSTDICMFQFHVNTIVYYQINPIKLKNDLNYCIDWHFKLMEIKKKVCKKLGNDAWTCYHSKKPSLRKQYKKLVERYL